MLFAIYSACLINVERSGEGSLNDYVQKESDQSVFVHLNIVT